MIASVFRDLTFPVNRAILNLTHPHAATERGKAFAGSADEIVKRRLKPTVIRRRCAENEAHLSGRLKL